MARLKSNFSPTYFSSPVRPHGASHSKSVSPTDYYNPMRPHGASQKCLDGPPERCDELSRGVVEALP